MKKLLFFLAVSALAQTGYRWNPFINNLDLVGLGYTAPSGYTSAAQSSVSTLSISLSEHGQGTTPAVACYQSSDGEQVLPQVLNAGLAGNLVLNFSPAFSGVCTVRGPGSGAGAAGNTVGPTSATSQSLACFSGTSGKILSMCTGLTTVGAVPFVSASGVLSQDQTSGGQFFWDATNHRLGVGTASPVSGFRATIVSEDNLSQTALYLRSNNLSAFMSLGWAGLKSSGVMDFMPGGSSNIALRLQATGNAVIGGGTNPADPNFKLDVQAEGSSGLARFWSQTPTTGTTLVAVRAGAGQSGNLFEWQNAGGGVLGSISATGNITVPVLFSTSVISAPEVRATSANLLLRDSAATGFGMLQFGSNTSSFPALKRNGVYLESRLADDSGLSDLLARQHRRTPVAVNSLQTCNAGNAGSDAAVNDALAPAWGVTVANGGAAYALVTCNGTNWRVTGI